MAAIRVQNEDTLECFLYPKFCYSMETDSVSETILNEEINKYNEFINQFTNDYLWHHDPLVFYPRTKQAIVLNQMLHTTTVSNDSSLVPHIYASLRFDEDVGDEWFTVFLIFKLTESFDGLIARLVDSDGEFLLIETADFLPRWLEPETCQDRVYIFDGRIHVVQDKRVPPIQQLKRISENSQNYLLSREVQDTLKKRLAAYPDELKLRKHKARAFLPEKAASILAQNPGFIAPAVRTIVHSDPLERKVCRAMRYFPPEQRTMVNVQMTKCLYAMSSHCRYKGDPRTGWNSPPTNSPKYNAHLLGIKIACGLEMLIARANEQLRRDDSSESIDDNQWREYRRRLEASGYFRSTLEGSKERERLTQTAKEYLIAHPLNSTYVSTDDNAALKILEAWKNVKTEDFEMHAQDEASLSPPDDDSWLNIDAAQLEAMLGQHWAHNSKKITQEPISLKEKVKVFLNQKSDADGIAFSSETLGDDENKNDVEDGRIDFDPEQFETALGDILDLVVPGDDGEFDGSSEGSLGGDEEDEHGGEIGEYMKAMDLQLDAELVKDSGSMSSCFKDSVESNLMESIEEEAGGAGPAGNIIGGPIRRLLHLQLQSPTTTVPDNLQS